MGENSLDFSIDVVLICDQCGEEMEPGEPGISLFHGLVGRGPKSGRMMVLETPLFEHSVANLHEWCVASFARESICDHQLDDEVLCAACDVVIEGDRR